MIPRKAISGASVVIITELIACPRPFQSGEVEQKKVNPFSQFTRSLEMDFDF